MRSSSSESSSAGTPNVSLVISPMREMTAAAARKPCPLLGACCKLLPACWAPRSKSVSLGPALLRRRLGLRLALLAVERRPNAPPPLLRDRRGLSLSSSLPAEVANISWSKAVSCEPAEDVAVTSMRLSVPRLDFMSRRLCTVLLSVYYYAGLG
ncbi:hypothetical protein Vretifemale_1148 [Volvox reticuliferus]|uniref:Uncharacterized protein n=1 Tax=Volvox reticuliferus TaxID=1737510 RepID=A0A8J4BX84_9CHLO|nr:hypothetical protein Vretifemale_1148 [Volvox reticuliferus]